MALISIIRFWILLCSGKIMFPNKYKDKIIQMDDGSKYKVFRHMKRTKIKSDARQAVFIVRFKFKKMSHKANIKASIIPIPMIGGFPSFRDKIWMIDWEKGYWQGVYEWESEEAVEKYKNSFVLEIMNKRADKNTLKHWIIPKTSVEDYMKKALVDDL